MKRIGLLWMSLGSLLTIIFSVYIAPLLEIILGDKGNQFTLRSTKVQAEVNAVNRSEVEKNEKAGYTQTHAVGFGYGEADSEIYYDEEDDDYENKISRN